MNIGASARLLVRMVAICLAAFLVCYSFPGFILQAVAPGVRILTDWISPYVHDVHLNLQNMTILVNCRLSIQMTLQDGSMLPAVPGTMQKSAWPMMQVLVVAFTVFAAPSSPIKRRLKALPFTLAAVALVCAYQESIEIQAAALQMIGKSWLNTNPLAFTEANQAYFMTMESWFKTLWLLKNINMGGGILFLAVLAGLVGYITPIHSPRNKGPQEKTALPVG